MQKLLLKGKRAGIKVKPEPARFFLFRPAKQISELQSEGGFNLKSRQSFLMIRCRSSSCCWSTSEGQSSMGL